MKQIVYFSLWSPSTLSIDLDGWMGFLHKPPYTMAKKNIGLYFFQLTPLGEDHKSAEYKQAFNDISKSFIAATKVEYNPLIKVDGRVNIYGKVVNKPAGYILGTLVNNQMIDIPPSYDNDTHSLAPLQLAESQGLGHPTSFLFDYQANILMIEVVRNGVGINSFCKFFKQNLDIPNFDANVIINPSDISKLDNMTTITKFQVKVAKIQDGSILKGPGRKSIGQIIESADETDTDSLDYTITSGRSKSLRLNKVKNFVRDFLKVNNADEVKTLKVTGREDDDSASFALDLIQQKLKDSISVEKERFIGNFYIDEKYKLMEEVYDFHRPGLLSAYKLK